MIFTIEPMLTDGNSACREWADDWTVVTVDGSLAAQFEVSPKVQRKTTRATIFPTLSTLAHGANHRKRG